MSLDFGQRDVARFQQHEQMKQHVGAFRDQMRAIVFDGRNDGFHRLLAELLGAMLRTLVQQLARIGYVAARRRAGIDGGCKIVDRKTAHKWPSITSLPR